MNIQIGATYREHEATEPRSFVKVSDTEDNKVVCHPVFGGFQANIPVDKFAEHFVVVPQDELDEIASTYAIEHFDFDEWETTIPAWTNGDRWNGWGCPHFERDVIKQAIDDGLIGDGNFVDAILFDDGALTLQANTGTLPAGHDWSEVVALLKAGEEIYDHEVVPGVKIQAEFFPTATIVVGGREIETYPLGAGSWCWNQYSEPRTEELPKP
ncbi:hypothetical protein D3C71_301440 [compost metagenome]